MFEKPDQDEIDRVLFDLTLECARPSWRFRFLFGVHERKLIGYAINTFMGQRHHNQFMTELDRRYGPNLGRNAGVATQAGSAQQSPV